MADVIIPEENLSNLLPSRLPSHIKAYYDGKQSMIFTDDVSPLPMLTDTTIFRLDYFNLDKDIVAETVFNAKLSAWCDLYSWPTQGIVIATPPVKENYVEIPGGSGSLDFAESLTGYPLYGNRTGSITWEIDPYRDNKTIDEIFSRINSRLHGKKMYALLVDEIKTLPDAYGEERPILEYSPWYYEGRLSVNSMSLGESSPQWNLNYNFKPYKKLLWTTCGDSSSLPQGASSRGSWVWDIFDFENGIDYVSIFNMTLTDMHTTMPIGSWIGDMPTFPTLTVESTKTKNECLQAAHLPQVSDSTGSDLGMLIRAHDTTYRSVNPQDTGYIWVDNCTNKKFPELTMCGDGIELLYDDTTGEEIADGSIVLDIYGTGTILFDMPIGVI